MGGEQGSGSHRVTHLSRALDTFSQPKQQILEKLHIRSLDIGLGTEHSDRTLRHTEQRLPCSAKPLGSHKEIEMS